MNCDAIRLEPLPGYQLQVELADGRRGVVDAGSWLAEPGMGRLRDADYFAQVSVALGAATWPEGEDVAPMTLAAALQTRRPA